MKKPILNAFTSFILALAAFPGVAAPFAEGREGTDARVWDWTADGTWTVFFSSKDLPPPSIASAALPNPFYMPSHDLSKKPKDMYPEDGWMLVYRDFGTPAQASPIPSLALYNRFSGKLRVIMYNASEVPSSYFKIEFSWENGQGSNGSTFATAHMAFSDPVRCFRSDFDPSHRELVVGFADQKKGWLYFDLPLVGYDPDLASKKPVLDYKISVIGIGNLEGSGDGGLMLRQIAEGQAIPGGTLGSGSDFQALKDGYKWYRDTRDWISSELEHPKNKQEPWYKLALAITAAAPAATSFAPWAAGLAGVVTSFIGGANATPAPVLMNFKGKLDFGLHATYTTEHNYYRDGLQLTFGGGDSSAHAPVQPIPWGVFSLESRPKVLVRRVLVRRRLERSIARGSVPGGADLQGYRCVLASLPSLNLNPDTGLSLVSARYAFTREDAGPTDYVADPSREPVLARNVPTGLAVELRFALPSHRNADPEEVVLKTVPVDVEMGPPIVSAEE